MRTEVMPLGPGVPRHRVRLYPPKDMNVIRWDMVPTRAGLGVYSPRKQRNASVSSRVSVCIDPSWIGMPIWLRATHLVDGAIKRAYYSLTIFPAGKAVSEIIEPARPRAYHNAMRLSKSPSSKV